MLNDNIVNIKTKLSQSWKDLDRVLSIQGKNKEDKNQ